MNNTSRKTICKYLFLIILGALVMWLLYGCPAPLCTVPDANNNRGLPKGALINCDELPNIFDEQTRIGSDPNYKSLYRYVTDDDDRKAIQTIITNGDLDDPHLFAISGEGLDNKDNTIRVSLKVKITYTTGGKETLNEIIYLPVSTDATNLNRYSIKRIKADGAMCIDGETGCEGTRTIYFGLEHYSGKDGISKLDKGTDITFTIEYTIAYDGDAIKDIKTVTRTIDKSDATHIYTWHDLQAIGNNLDVNYILQNNIVFPSKGTYGFDNFIPITGNNNEAFSGSLDGNNKKSIENLYISQTSGNAGLFATIDNSMSGDDTFAVRNLTFKNASITGGGNVGLLAGTLTNGKISGIVIDETTTITGSIVGGIVGYMVGGSLIEATNNSTIKQCSVGGGLVGAIKATAAVQLTGKNTQNNSTSCTTYGGLVGKITTTDSTVDIVGQNTNAVQATTNAGGLVGTISGNGSGTIAITGFTTTGAIGDSTTTNVGGLIGSVNSNATVELTGYSNASVVGGNTSNKGSLIGSVKGGGNVTIRGYSTGKTQVIGASGNTTLHGTAFWWGVSSDNTIITTCGSSTTGATGSSFKCIKILDGIPVGNEETSLPVNSFLKMEKNFPQLRNSESPSFEFLGQDIALPILFDFSVGYFTDNADANSFVETKALSAGFMVGGDNPFKPTFHFVVTSADVSKITIESSEATQTVKFSLDEDGIGNITNVKSGGSYTPFQIGFTVGGIDTDNQILEYANFACGPNLTVALTATISNSGTTEFTKTVEKAITKSCNIRSERDLQGIQYDLTKDYKLINDIELTSAWTPIGNSIAPFTGSLQGWTKDGNSAATISNFSIKAPSGDANSIGVGLFGVVDSTQDIAINRITIALKADSVGCTGNNCAINNSADVPVGAFVGLLQQGKLDNLTLIKTPDDSPSTIYSTSIGDSSSVGGLVGKIGSNSGEIENSHISGVTIKAIGSYEKGKYKGGGRNVGGVVGHMAGGSVTNAKLSDSTIEGVEDVGGLVGLIALTDGQSTIAGQVENSRIGKQKSTNERSNFVGGLVGSATTTKNSNSEVYSNIYGVVDTTTIKGSRYVGGLVGQATNYTRIRGYSLKSKIDATGAYIGGLVGQIDKVTELEGYTSKATFTLAAGSSIYGPLVGQNNSSTINAFVHKDINTKLVGQTSGIGTSKVFASSCIKFIVDEEGVRTIQSDGLNPIKTVLFTFATSETLGIGEWTVPDNEVWTAKEGSTCEIKELPTITITIPITE